MNFNRQARTTADPASSEAIEAIRKDPALANSSSQAKACDDTAALEYALKDIDQSVTGSQSVSGQSIMRMAATRLAIGAVLALILQLVICIHEFSDEMYLAKHFVKLEVSRLTKAALFKNDRLIIAQSPSLSHFQGENARAYAYRIFDSSGKLRAARNNELFRQANIKHHNSRIELHNWLRRFGPSGTFHIAGAVERKIGGQILTIEVATRGDPDMQRLFGFLRYFWHDLSTEILPTIFLITAFVLFSLRGAFAPFLRLAQRVEQIEPASRLPPFDLDGLPKEAASFASAINRLLVRNQTLMQSQQRLAATTAHEMRTPLHVMMLELRNIPGAAARRIEADIKEMSHKIDGLLALARMEAIKGQEQTAVDLPAIVAAEADKLKALYESNQDTIELVEDHPTSFYGDHQSIRQAVRNLIENASKHTPKGTRVIVTCGPGSRLVVENGGARLDKNMAHRLFDPFFRGDTQAEGSGLGLAIVKQAVTLHEGTICVDRSALGGARFTIDFSPRLGQ